MLTDEIIRYLTKHELLKFNRVPEITQSCLDNYYEAVSLLEEYKTGYTRYVRTPHELIESFYDLLLVAQEKLEFGLFDAIQGADFVSKYPSRWKTLEPKDFVFCETISPFETELLFLPFLPKRINLSSCFRIKSISL